MGERAERLADLFARQYPAEWAMLYPRIYNDTGRYHSSKFLEVTLLHDVLTRANDVKGDFSRMPPDFPHKFMGMMELGEHLTPTYFIAPDFLEAVCQTKPSEPIEWASMHLPFEAASGNQ